MASPMFTARRASVRWDGRFGAAGRRIENGEARSLKSELQLRRHGLSRRPDLWTRPTPQSLWSPGRPVPSLLSDEAAPPTVPSSWVLDRH